MNSIKKPVLCPVCLEKKSRVIDKRGGYRRRECPNGHRYSTQEKIIEFPEPEQYEIPWL